MQEVDSECNWTMPLISYLRTGLPSDGKEAASKLKFQASRFVLIKDVVYKRGFSRSYLRGICGLRNERSSRGYLWKPLRGMVVSAQDDSSWVLLANYAERCISLCKTLRQVSKVQQFHQTTIQRANTHDGPLAIRLMGTRYHGSFPNRG